MKPLTKKIENMTPAEYASARLVAWCENEPEKAAAEIERLREAVVGERERCAKRVPTNWLDSLLTGPRKVGELPFGAREIEALLRGVQDRIRALTDEPSVSNGGGKSE